MNKLKSSVKHIALTPVDDLFSSEESRTDANRERVVELPLTGLHCLIVSKIFRIFDRPSLAAYDEISNGPADHQTRPRHIETLHRTH